MRTVVGLFQDTNEARRTIEDLKRIGVVESDVSLLSNEDANGPMVAYLDPAKAPRDPEGIQTALVRMGLSDGEARRYVAGIEQGYTLETVSIDDAKANDALEIMRSHAIGTGARGGLAGQPQTRARAGGAEEAILPVIIEELAVGKREVEAGGVHATSTVESKPVEQDISLRTESIDVERRTVNRPVESGDTEAFRDRDVEVVARSEEPVVEKSARVVEEVVVKKYVDTRTETIKDTVRHTDVHVERIPYEPATYRGHHASEYGKTGVTFEEYEPAYRFGHELRAGEREGTGEWSTVEPQARTRWEQTHPNTWERFKGAIRHAWERATG